MEKNFEEKLFDKLQTNEYAVSTARFLLDIYSKDLVSAETMIKIIDAIDLDYLDKQQQAVDKKENNWQWQQSFEW